MGINRTNGNNYGVQAGRVRGDVRVDGRGVTANGVTDEDDDSTQVNEVNGNNYGVQAGQIDGDISFG
jgi:hypothetical protein